jgi:hypothetical protein
MLSHLNMHDVCDLYGTRVKIHKKLRSFLQHGNISDDTQLALGLSNADANYSAAEHGLGLRILTHSSTTINTDGTTTLQTRNCSFIRTMNMNQRCPMQSGVIYTCRLNRA